MTSSVTLEHSTNSLICNSLKEKFPEFEAPSIIFICNLKYVCRFFAYNKITFHRRKLKFLETNCGYRTPAYRSRSVNRSYFNVSPLCMLSTSCTKSFYHNLDAWYSLGSCRVTLYQFKYRSDEILFPFSDWNLHCNRTEWWRWTCLRIEMYKLRKAAHFKGKFCNKTTNK